LEIGILSHPLPSYIFLSLLPYFCFSFLSHSFSFTSLVRVRLMVPTFRPSPG
jgi:hypothetical protein